MGNDFREGWTVKSGKSRTPWHYFRKGEKRSVCGSWTREGTGILAYVAGVGKSEHCKTCLKIYCATHPELAHVERNRAFDGRDNIEIKRMTMNDEIKDLIKLIDQLESLRVEHTLTYEGLHKVTGVMQDFAWGNIKAFSPSQTGG